MKRIYADSHPPLLNPRDIDFLLYEWLDVGALCDRPRYSEHSIESFDAVLDLAADIAIKRFAPHFKTADTQEPFVNPDGTVTTLPEMKEALSAARRVERTTGVLWADGDPPSALANATMYLEAVGHVVLAWIWLQQAVAAHGKAGDFYEGKRLAARYFFHYELPKTTAQFDLLDIGDRTTIDLDENWF